VQPSRESHYTTSLFIWRVRDGQQLATLKGHTDAIISMAFSPDGLMLASASGHPASFTESIGDKTIRLWRVSDGKPLMTLDAPDGEVTGLAFSPDGTLLATGDKAIRLWRTK
jgi:WD40 repeat protein